MPARTIAEWVTENRQALGLTQAELADRSAAVSGMGGRMSRETISRVESQRQSSLATIKRRALERVFGVEYPALLAEKPAGSPEPAAQPDVAEDQEEWFLRLSRAVESLGLAHSVLTLEQMIKARSELERLRNPSKPEARRA